MDFGWSEREELLRKSVKEFAESEISPKIDAMEETGNFPTELLAPMAKLGITGIIAPPEYSGIGLGYLARTIVLEELGRVCAAIPMGLQVHHMAIAAINDFGTAEQKQKYIPRLAMGETMGCVAVTEPSGGSYLLRGSDSGRLHCPSPFSDCRTFGYSQHHACERDGSAGWTAYLNHPKNRAGICQTRGRTPIAVGAGQSGQYPEVYFVSRNTCCRKTGNYHVVQ